MCGRYVKEITDHILNYHEYLQDFIDASRAPNATSQYNVAPSTMQDLRCDDGGGSIVQPGKWVWFRIGPRMARGIRSTHAPRPVMRSPCSRNRSSDVDVSRGRVATTSGKPHHLASSPITFTSMTIGRSSFTGCGNRGTTPRPRNPKRRLPR